MRWIEPHIEPAELRSIFPELTLTLLILGGGLYPQLGVSSRYHAAVKVAETRERLFPRDDAPEHGVEVVDSGAERESDALVEGVGEGVTK